MRTRLLVLGLVTALTTTAGVSGCANWGCQGWVALTFDDGPTKLTSQLLQVLRDHEVPATFFNVGTQERLYPDKVKDTALEGHELANHTMTHADLLTLPQDKALEEIVDASEVHEDIGLPAQRLFRPPFGSTSPDLRHAVETDERLKMTEVLWTVDSKDYETPDPAQVLAQSKGMVDGGIVLLHDGKPQTIEALPEIITYYEDQGFCWGTIGRGDQDVPTVAGLPMIARAVPPPRH